MPVRATHCDWDARPPVATSGFLLLVAPCQPNTSTGNHPIGDLASVGIEREPSRGRCRVHT
jgi:hypothetical protein